MLFGWEQLSHQVLMVVVLASAAIVAIIINSLDLSGKRKFNVLKGVHTYNTFFLIPASLYLFVLQIVGLIAQEYVTIANSMWRFSTGFAGISILLLALFRIYPLAKEGLGSVKNKSLNTSKHQTIFRKLRASFMAIMIFMIFAYWMQYMFR